MGRLEAIPHIHDFETNGKPCNCFILLNGYPRFMPVQKERLEENE